MRVREEDLILQIVPYGTGLCSMVSRSKAILMYKSLSQGVTPHDSMTWE